VPNSCPYVGISLFADRNSTGAISITNGGSVSYSGTIYAASALLTVAGGGQTLVLNSWVVVDSLTLGGSGLVRIDGTGIGGGAAGLPYLVG